MVTLKFLSQTLYKLMTEFGIWSAAREAYIRRHVKSDTSQRESAKLFVR